MSQALRHASWPFMSAIGSVVLAWIPVAGKFLTNMRKKSEPNALGLTPNGWLHGQVAWRFSCLTGEWAWSKALN